MPKPYSYDLRQKVIQAIELSGMSQHQAAMIPTYLTRVTDVIEVGWRRKQQVRA